MAETIAVVISLLLVSSHCHDFHEYV